MHPTRRALILAAAGGVVFPSAGLRAAPSAIGSVARARGPGQLILEAVRPLAAGAGIAPRERVRTGDDARAEIRFADGGVLTLGAGTDLVIDSYVVGSAGRGARLGIGGGVFRMVTAPGRGPANLTVHTPVATLGIRGTDFWGEQSADRLRLVLLSGGPIDVTTAAGTQTLTEAGTLVEATRDGAPTPPRALTPEAIAAAARTVAF